MAINFPDSPSNNDIYTVNGKRWIYSNGKWSIYGTTAPDATASDTEPSGVGDGHIWYRSDQSQTLIRYDNTWVEVGSAGGFDNASTNFPTSLDSATGFAAVEALQAKVGVDSSAVTSSLDYKVAQLEAISHGKILQVVSTTKTDTFSTTSLSMVDVTGLSAAITPQDTNSKVLVLVDFINGNNDAIKYNAYNLVRNGTTIAQPTGGVANHTTHSYPNNGSGGFAVNINYLDSPASATSVTYKIQMAVPNGGTGYLGRYVVADARAISTITLIEVSA